jgi:hypothetical protein
MRANLMYQVKMERDPSHIFVLNNAVLMSPHTFSHPSKFKVQGLWMLLTLLHMWVKETNPSQPQRSKASEVRTFRICHEIVQKYVLEK